METELAPQRGLAGYGGESIHLRGDVYAQQDGGVKPVNQRNQGDFPGRVFEMRLGSRMQIRIRLFIAASRIGKLSAIVSICGLTGLHAELDLNGNQQSDIWEVRYGAPNLPSQEDYDADGFTNAVESLAGTNPLDATSFPKLGITNGLPGQVNLGWASERGKSYELYGSQDMSGASWQLLGTSVGDGLSLLTTISTAGQARWFFKLKTVDVDTDADGLTNWEEWHSGLNANNANTFRLGNDGANVATTDKQHLTASWNLASTITVGLLDADMREDWPDKGVIAIRRSGGVQPVTVNISLTGTATRGGDYSTIAGNQVSLGLGVREAWVEFAPINDATVEGQETIILTVTAGAGYTVGSPASATVLLDDPSVQPSAKAAARFMIQAAFGPDQDSAADGDDIPENVEEVMASGYEAWINDQFTRPIGYLQPWVDWAVTGNMAQNIQLYGNYKEFSWWGRAMGSPKLRPDAEDTQLPDPLRQRVAFALSEILVASDRPEALAVEQQGMANFYDLMVKHAFGNYRDLLYDVATHPVMGVFLSHLNNQKANPDLNTYPDENFAREVMQLFSIGLWKLNVDGSRQLDAQNQPIPTYTNSDITELARVFTGMTFADKNFPGTNGDYTQPMKMWDGFHDCDSKVLLGGFVVPARTASAGNTGTAGLADVNDAITNLFNQPSVGPFIAKQMIQRLVTSNPSPAYIGRVAAAFNGTNPVGPRGDLKAVVKAILLDSEARDPAMMEVPTWGKLREPFLRVVNFARAFNAASTSGYYALDQFSLDHLQDPMNAPSVFNFFLPAHSPPGPITQLGLVAPEFQIINASSAVTGSNYFWSALGNNTLNPQGAGDASYAVQLQINAELGMITSGNINADVPAGPALDPDPVIRRLDMVLTGGTLSPQEFQIIREAMMRIPTFSWRWHRERLRLAVYMITNSADFNVLR